MLRLANWLKKLYKRRKVNQEIQWPPCRRRKLVNLHLVECEAFVSEQKVSESGKAIKHTPINCSELFQSKPGENEIQLVLLEGHAGIGKTTFCTIVTEDWANGELFQQFKLVLLLPLRDERVATAESLTDLVKRMKNNDKLCNSVIEEFDENGGENVLIVADGWDELSPSQRGKGFLYNLLIECSELPSASILLTSRPTASAPLHELQCFDRFVQVVGFNRNNIEEYFSSELTLEKSSLLVDQLDHNPMIESICAIPLNCAIVCHLFRELGGVLPSTMTELYTKIILLIIARNIAKKHPEYGSAKSLQNFHSFPEPLQTYWWLLCEFAFWAIENSKIAFSHNEIEKFFPKGSASLDEDLSCFGLLQSFEALLSGGVGQGLSLNFLHLTIQEYLAALHVVRQTPDKQVKICQVSRNLDIVWRFFFGLCCNNKLVDVYESDPSLCPTLSHKFIRTFVRSKKHRSRMYFNMTSLLCQCSFEANDNHFTSLVAEALEGRFTMRYHFYRGNLTPHDCFSVMYVIAHAQAHAQAPPLSIDFSKCNLGDRGVVPLASALGTKSKQVQNLELNLIWNKLTDRGVTDLFAITDSALQSISRLYLAKNMIGEVGVRAIMTTLSIGGPSKLTSLSLSDNPLGVAGFLALEDAIQAGTLVNLSSLMLTETLTEDPDINGAVLTTFLDALSLHCRKFCCIDLSNNYLGVAGAQAVGNALPKLTESQSESNYYYYCVCLLNTKLGDEGMIAFCQSLQSPCYLRKLFLKKNSLHHEALITLSESVFSGNLNVSELTLDDNPLGIQAIPAIGRMLSSTWCPLNSLSMNNCTLTCTKQLDHANGSTEDIDVRRSEIVEQVLRLPTNKSLQSLHVYRSDFSGKNCAVLCAIISQCISLERFSSADCNLSSKDLQFFFSHISNDRLTFSNWYMIENRVDSDGVNLLIENMSAMPFITSISLDTNAENESVIEKLNLILKDREKINHKKCKEQERKQELTNAILMTLNENDTTIIKSLLEVERTVITSISTGPLIQKLRYLLFLVYMEAVYMLLPGFPHQRTTIRLKVVKETDTVKGLNSTTFDGHVFTLTLPPVQYVFSRGLRVVRGRDWDPVNDEDGGEGHVGTLVEISEASSDGGRTALVQWDCGNTGLYRCGVEGKFDLRVFDSAPTGNLFGLVECDSCDKHPIRGMVWRCCERLDDRDYELCSLCYHAGKTVLKDSLEHEFKRHDRTTYYYFVRSDSRFSVKVSPRAGARRLEAKGIFPGAEVVRGPDWNHGDDDGADASATGVVTEVINKLYAGYLETEEAGVEVEWNTTKIKTTCRLGWEGKVDVKCVNPSSGGYYYPDHLPMLGAPYSLQQEQIDRVREEQERRSLHNQELTEQACHDKQQLVESFSGIDEHDSPRDSTILNKDFGDAVSVVEGDELRADSEVNSSNGRLNVNDLRSVRTAIWDVRAQWYNVGIELDVDTPSLDAIRENCHHKVEDCFTAMIKEWLQHVHPPPTWSGLVEALRSPPVNSPQVAEQL